MLDYALSTMAKDIIILDTARKQCFIAIRSLGLNRYYPVIILHYFITEINLINKIFRYNHGNCMAMENVRSQLHLGSETPPTVCTTTPINKHNKHNVKQRRKSMRIVRRLSVIGFWLI
jgi:hypothetical protein